MSADNKDSTPCLPTEILTHIKAQVIDNVVSYSEAREDARNTPDNVSTDCRNADDTCCELDVTADGGSGFFMNVNNVGPQSPLEEEQRKLVTGIVSSVPNHSNIVLQEHTKCTLLSAESTEGSACVGNNVCHESCADTSNSVDSGRLCVENLAEDAVENSNYLCDSDSCEASQSRCRSSLDEFTVKGPLMYDLPPLVETQDHAILVDVETVSTIPVPFPEKARMKYFQGDDRYVILPYAEERRWSLISNALGCNFCRSVDIQRVVESYQYVEHRMDFAGLHEYMNRKEDMGDCQELLSLFGQIAKLAIEIPDICTRPIPILRNGFDSSITMSQNQAACLLANAFFCTFPQSESYYSCRHLTFAGLFRKPSTCRQEAQFAKLDCIFNYFRRITNQMPCGTITFHRQVSVSKI